MALRSGGLATGLDTNTIIKQLVAIESQPINKLKRQQSGYSTQISKIGKIKSALMALKSQQKALDTTKEFLVATATPSDTDFFTASATGDASLSNYDITVGQLAVAEKDRSVAFASSTAAVKAGTLKFSVKGGEAQSVTITDGMTVASLASKINSDVTGVSASVVVGKNETRLIVTANDKGHTVGSAASSAITITESYTEGVVSGTELGFTELTTAKNAQMTIDGVLVESESNDVTDALTGVSFKLKKVTTKTETLAVAKDNEKIAENVSAFVEKYNALISLLNAETKVSAGTNRYTSLGGDNAIRSLSQALKKVASAQIPSVKSNKYNSLNTVGIKNLNGKMSLDTTKLNKALDDKLQQVSAIFTAVDGIAAQIIPIADAYGGTGGLLQSKTEGLNKSIRNIDNRVSTLQNRVEKFEAQLVKQFTSLEQSVAAMQKQGNFLAGSIQ